MNTFEDRKKSFEKKFAHDEELQFKVSARRNKYIGEWKNGKKSGQGGMIYENGDLYDGGWKQGKRNGQGTLTLKNGDISHKGEWKEGEPKN